jgi:hypothetical protein
MECIKCKAQFEPSDAAAHYNSKALLALAKDWQLWVLALVMTLAAGITAGGLNLPTSWFMGGSGAVLGVVITLRLRTIVRCPTCSAVFQSAPFFGRKRTP